MDGLEISIIGADNIFKELDETPALVNGMVKTLYQEAMDNTYSSSQANAPVDKGDLVGSGATKVDDNGTEFCFEVSYGDGQEGKIYTYPPGDSTSQFSDGSIEAGGYVLFEELGHMSRAGNPVAPHPYLGPAFDASVIDLMDKLLELFS